jgi:ATP-dependent DNA helicase RecG
MSTTATDRALGLPVDERGRALVNAREDQWLDRKSSRISGRDLADSLVGFANAEGGSIVIGLWNGQVEGVDRAAGGRVAQWQQAAFDFTMPTVVCRSRLVECVNDAGQADHLFLIDVDTSERVHANRRDEVFLRVGDENRRLTFAQRQDLLYDKGQSSFESTAVEGAELEDLDGALLAAYAGAVGHPDPQRLLAARGLITPNGQLAVAAILLFAEQPQRWLPEANIRVLRYRGNERGTGARQQLVNDERIDGPIPTQLAQARKEIAKRLPKRRALGRGGRFESVGLLPQDAWLEAVVNAVVHRSYSVSGDHIRVEIFDDRVEVESPGRFPGIADTKDPLHITRFARNPRIARACADLRYGQELGEGIRRMYEEMRLAGLADPTYFQTSGSVRVTLSSSLIDHASESNLPPGARDLLRLVRNAGRVSTGELVEASGLSRPFVIRQLKALEEAEIVQWVGNSAKDPRAYWTPRVG